MILRPDTDHDPPRTGRRVPAVRHGDDGAGRPGGDAERGGLGDDAHHRRHRLPSEDDRVRIVRDAQQRRHGGTGPQDRRDRHARRLRRQERRRLAEDGAARAVTVTGDERAHRCDRHVARCHVDESDPAAASWRPPARRTAGRRGCPGSRWLRRRVRRARLWSWRSAFSLRSLNRPCHAPPTAGSLGVTRRDQGPSPPPRSGERLEGRAGSGARSGGRPENANGPGRSSLGRGKPTEATWRHRTPPASSPPGAPA